MWLAKQYYPEQMYDFVEQGHNVKSIMYLLLYHVI